jgi:hypothetical protein
MTATEAFVTGAFPRNLRARSSRARRVSSGATTDVNCLPTWSPTIRRAAFHPPDDAGAVDHVAGDVDVLERALDVRTHRLQCRERHRSSVWLVACPNIDQAGLFE